MSVQHWRVLKATTIAVRLGINLLLESVISKTPDKDFFFKSSGFIISCTVFVLVSPSCISAANVCHNYIICLANELQLY